MLLNDVDVVAFYEKHKLLPGQEVFVSSLIEYLTIVFQAFNKGKSFGYFVRESLVPIGHHEYKVYFASWEELINCYQSFMTSYNRIKSNAKQN